MDTSSSGGSSGETIKHIVISSGGPAGHMMYSILRTLNLKGVWEFDNIKSIYGSSVGSFAAVLIALHYDWSVIDDYLIKRPFEKIFTSGFGLGLGSGSGSGSDCRGTGGGNSTFTGEPPSTETSTFSDAKNKFDFAYRLYNNKGLYGLKEFTEMLRPPLQGKDIALNVTFQEFYERTGVEIHFIVTELNSFTAVDFSHKTHPNQQVIEACYMSCCYPLGFTPVYRDGCCYLDGGIINEYPLNECIRDQKCKLSEILGIKMMWERKPANLTDKSSMFQFIGTFLNQINANFFENRIKTAIPNEVVCVSKIFTGRDWLNWAMDEKYRRELILRGETFANVFLSYRRNYQATNNMVHNQEPASLRGNLNVEDTIQKLPVSLPEPDAAAAAAAPDPAAAAAPDPDNATDTTVSDLETFQIHNTDITMV